MQLELNEEEAIALICAMGITMSVMNGDPVAGITAMRVLESYKGGNLANSLNSLKDKLVPQLQTSGGRPVRLLRVQGEAGCSVS